MVKLDMRNIFKLVLMFLLFSQIAHAEIEKIVLPLADLSTYVAKQEKADSYDVRRLFIKKDPSFKNGLVILNVMCGQGLCTNYIFAKTLQEILNLSETWMASSKNHKKVQQHLIFLIFGRKQNPAMNLN